MIATTLSDLVRAGIGTRVIGDPMTRVRGVHQDSRGVEAGDLFVAIQGESADGLDYVVRAEERGASALLSDREATGSRLPLLLSENIRRDFGRAAHVIYGDPTAALKVVGVTGTNGKTTVTYLLDQVLASLGIASGMIGTVTTRGPGFVIDSDKTTPEADDLARLSRRFVDAKASHLLMEVSSHALALGRVEGMRFDVAAFTNLTQDHLDFHKTFDEYQDAKSRLFFDFAPETSVVNIDDAFGKTLSERLIARPGRPCLTCSVERHPAADVALTHVQTSSAGSVANAKVGTKTYALKSPLVGHHNLENLAVVLGVVNALGLNVANAVAALTDAVGAPGRLERVASSVGDIFVDYAHTPDALQRVLTAMRPLTRGRLIVVFGCGGDRDREKRSVMGCIGATVADVAIITSDNPRTEEPSSIIGQVMTGVRSVASVKVVDEEELLNFDRGSCATSIVDRRRAIALAVSLLREGDVLVIAGKGHETYQVVGKDKLSFDDRQVALAAAQLRDAS